MTTSVLIIEDNATKRTALENALPDHIAFEVDSRPSIVQAYRALRQRTWDLVILDMTFQVSGGKAGEVSKEALAGIEILQYMDRMDIPGKVIVATQHSSFAAPDHPTIKSVAELHRKLQKLFPRNYLVTVGVDLSNELWKAAFQRHVESIVGGAGE